MKPSRLGAPSLRTSLLGSRLGLPAFHGIAGAACVLGALAFLAPRAAQAEGPAAPPVSTVAPSSAGARVAVIDLRRAVTETEEGMRVTAALKTRFDKRQVELDQRQRQLQTDKEALDKDAGSKKFSAEALQKRYEKLQKDAADTQNLLLSYQQEMQRMEQESTTPILQKLLSIVKRVASQEGYEAVLMKDAVAFVRADLELTDRAIQLYNQETATTSPAAPAAPKSGK